MLTRGVLHAPILRCCLIGMVGAALMTGCFPRMPTGAAAAQQSAATDASFSPDGSTILFAANHDGDLEIFVVNADGSDRRQLTDNGGQDFFPSWAPDGNTVVFSSDRPGRGGRRNSRRDRPPGHQFFRVRFYRLTVLQQKYLRAMAELGPGPHKAGRIATTLGVVATSGATVRQQLVNKGMVWSQRHGETAFNVPLFDSFMKRQMPTLEKHAPARRTRPSSRRNRS